MKLGAISPMFPDSSRGTGGLDFGAEEFLALGIRGDGAQHKGVQSSRIGCTGNGVYV